MYKESAGKLFLKYAVPQMIGLLFNSVYVIVDGVSSLWICHSVAEALTLLICLIISVRMRVSNQQTE